MPEKPISDEAKCTFRMVRRGGGSPLQDQLHWLRLSDAERYRLRQARDLILEAGWVEDPDNPGQFLPPSEPT